MTLIPGILALLTVTGTVAYMIGHNFGRRRGREESMDMARYWREMFWVAWEEDRPVRRFGETANRG